VRARAKRFTATSLNDSALLSFGRLNPAIS
jgi:hypothetical protein